MEKKVGIAYGAAAPGQEYPNRVSFLIGADGKIEKVYPKVAARTHPADLLVELTA